MAEGSSVGIRIPPHSAQAEAAVLSAMLINQEAFYKAFQTLRPECFYDRRNRVIAEALQGLFERNQTVDLVTASEELKRKKKLEDAGGLEYLSSLTENLIAPAHVEEHSRIVYGKWVQRQLIDISTRIVQEAYDSSISVDDMLDKAEHLIFEIKESKLRGGFVSLKELLVPAMRTIDKAKQEGRHITGIPTGFTDLDRMTSGMQRGELVIVAGRPSMGKSSLALNLAVEAAKREGARVGLFSLEMTTEMVVERIICSEAGVSLARLRSGHLSMDDYARLSNVMGVLNELPIFIDDTPSLSILELKAKARRLHAEGGLGMVIVDYLQLLDAGAAFASQRNRQQEITEISRSLKALAKEVNAPVMALSQLSRRPEMREDKRPQLADLRESGCLTADAEIIRADSGEVVTLGELFENEERNIPIWTMDENLKLVKGTITHVFPSGIKSVYRMKLRSGREIKASANHPFYTYQGWKRLDKLMAGERVAIARRIEEPTDTITWPDEKVILLAHLIGDGSFVKRQPIRYATKDEENLEVVTETAKFFGVRAKGAWDKKARSYQLRLPASYHLTHGVRNPIAEWLDSLGLFEEKSSQKFIPEAVFSLNNRQIALFLRHLWSTDGHIGVDKFNRITIYYSTNSQRLCKGLANLLLRIGIVSRIHRMKKKGYRDALGIYVSGASFQREFLEQVGAFGPRIPGAKKAIARLRIIAKNTNIDTIPKQVWELVKSRMKEQGFSHRRFSKAMDWAYCGSSRYRFSPSRENLSKVALTLRCKRLLALANSDLLWDQILDIEYLGDFPVYDASVAEFHNFLANGVVVHNSIEQDADLVLLIHRPGFYHPKEEEDSTGSITKLIIAKQRNGPTGELDLVFLKPLMRFESYVAREQEAFEEEDTEEIPL